MSACSCHTTCSAPAPEASEAELARLSAVFKALGHPVRLRLAMLLMSGERCVCELHADSARDMSTISSHLSILQHSGVITSCRRGKHIYYRLSCACLGDVISCLSSL